MKIRLSDFGPGLLYAGAAVGVSHLVQSTRAGANYGLWMLLIIIAINLVKYPFFEFANRYTSTTKKSLLDAYAGIGKWAVVLFIFLTVLTMFAIQGAIVTVTSGLAIHIFDLDLSTNLVSLTLLIITGIILYLGKYSLLDKLMKFIIISLAVTSLIAAVLSLDKNFARTDHFQFVMDLSRDVDLYFLIALIGWMPAPIDITVWQSVWTRERQKSDTNFNTQKANLDFKVGYWGTVVIAVFFVILGSMNLFHSGTELEANGGKFAAQLLGIFTSNIGQWSYAIIAAAAFTTMLSTNLSVMDAYPRVLHASFEKLGSQFKLFNYNLLMSILIVGTSIVLVFAMQNMKQMVDLATTLSFLSAPILAWFNIKIVTDKSFVNKPGKFLISLAYLGLLLMLVLAFIYLYTKFWN
jgi:Mn2+/Fe2+ NRAMP family transporter